MKRSLKLFSKKQKPKHNRWMYRQMDMSKELILLEFVDITCFSYFLICAIFHLLTVGLHAAIFIGKWLILYERSGPSCSKLTMLKFIWSDTQIC